jgi:hypothetical protein
METTTMSRRRLMAVLGLAAGSLAAPGCLLVDRMVSQHRVALGADPTIERDVLRAFVDAVVPGLDQESLRSPNLTRVFYDSDLPFAPYHLDLSAHLCKSAARRHGDWRFHWLSPTHRRAVIAAGLADGGQVGQLYTGAVFLAQAATYSGFYDDAAGCPLIEFEGAGGIQHWAEMSYPDPGTLYAADPACPGGHPA